MRFRLALAAAAFLVTTPAFAQQDREEDQKPRETYLPNEIHDFEKGLEIDGITWKPSGIYIDSHGIRRAPKLIEERANFKRDLAESVGRMVISPETKTIAD